MNGGALVSSQGQCFAVLNIICCSKCLVVFLQKFDWWLAPQKFGGWRPNTMHKTYSAADAGALHLLAVGAQSGCVLH